MINELKDSAPHVYIVLILKLNMDWEHLFYKYKMIPNNQCKMRESYTTYFMYTQENDLDRTK